MTSKLIPFACLAAVLSAGGLRAQAPAAATDGEVWNEGVEYYRAGDFTNALRVLRPLLCSKTHGPRAAEVVAKLAYEGGDLEEAAHAAQLALRAAPGDAKANRNFTRATDGLPQARETKRIEGILKAAQGKDPGALLLAATREARALMPAAVACRTNPPARAVAQADALQRRAEQMADAWIPVRELIARSVTNETQAATILPQIEQAERKTKLAARQLGDLDAAAYGSVADVEHDFTRFLKLTALPPTAIDEDLVAQSNAWMDVEAFNGRAWQEDALDYTRSFRAKFPGWAQAYEQAAQSDTNRPPFTKETQGRISALATELEQLQIECCTKSLPSSQERSMAIIAEIRELLPKDPSGGGSQNQHDSQDRKNPQDQPQGGEAAPQPDEPSDQRQEQDPNQQQGQQRDEAAPPDESQAEAGEREEDPEIEAVLKKAQERNDEHEADKRERMRKAPLPPNERDW